MSNIFSKTKQTKRFTYTINRNSTAKRAGSNTVTIATNAYDGQYSVPQAAFTLSVKEAQVLQGFLNDTLVISE
jgi:hypothetical protein|tara:strand:+ start:657 stop:875 length:219 start_codon:yes stop_codon:yes gene_type:complete